MKIEVSGASNMTKFLRTSLAAVLFAWGPLHAEVRMQAVEKPIESTTSYLNLPGELPGTFALAPCSEGCVPVRLRLETDSKFVANGASLTFEQLLKFAAIPGRNITVFYDSKTFVVTRIVIAN